MALPEPLDVLLMVHHLQDGRSHSVRTEPEPEPGSGGWGSYVVVDEEAHPGLGVVQGGESLKELLHEGSRVFDEDGHKDQRHVVILEHSLVTRVLTH